MQSGIGIHRRVIELLKELTERNVVEVTEFLKQHLEDCIYLYIDIKKYGLTNPAMNVWYEKDADRIHLVVMRYHTSITFFAKNDNYNLDTVIGLIIKYKPNSISTTKKLAERLHLLLDNYDVSYGYIIRFIHYPDFGGNHLVESAKDDDMLEIARLVTSDEGIGSYYELQDLADQFLERRRCGMGRNYIVRENGRIVGHVASYAELDHIGTEGGLIVRPDCRGKRIGSILEGYFIREMLGEGYRLYSFASERRCKVLVRMGNEIATEYGKLTKHARTD